MNSHTVETISPRKCGLIFFKLRSVGLKWEVDFGNQS